MTDASVSIKSAVTSPGPFADNRRTFGSSESDSTTKPFTLRTMSTLSWGTPWIVQNSCSAPLTRIDVIAAPSIVLSKIRRRLLPIVVPNQRSNGSIVNRPNVSVADCSSRITLAGSSSPRHRTCIMMHLLFRQWLKANKRLHGLGT